jgi:hypothetical protein
VVPVLPADRKPILHLAILAFLFASPGAAERTQGRLRDRMSIQGFDTAKHALACGPCRIAVGGPKTSEAQVKMELEGLYLYTANLGPVRESHDAYEIRVAERRGQRVYLNCGDIFFAPANVRLTDGDGETINLLRYHERVLGLVDDSLTVEKFQAAYLLHELGHVLAGLPRDFGNAALSVENTRTVMQRCFRELLP